MTKIWSCGVRSLPATIEGDPPVPTLGVMWMCKGFVVGASVFEGTAVTDAQLRESFDQAVARPMAGAPAGRPSRIGVDSAPLARRLREILPEVRVDVRPTPEVDDALESLVQAMSGPRLDPMPAFMELDEAVRDALMPAALGLFELAPWEIFPPDVPVRVSIPRLGVEEGRLAVMGHNGDTYGAMLFLSQEDFDFFAACGEGMLDPTGVVLPKCFSLNYVPIDAASVGGDPAHGAFPLPLLSVFERDTQRGPSRSEAKPMLAAITGLARFAERRAHELAVPRNWEAGVRGRYRVDVLGDRLEVRLAAKR
jgi:hypothetical protein